jgi:hypothetical protein
MTKRPLALAILCILLATTTLRAAEPRAAQAEISELLDRFHRAAAEADGELYFSLFADGAVFIGTDVGERWSVDEFKAFAEPYFSTGRGWTYESRERHIAVAPGGETAWFDEILLNDSYGTCRGSGVVRHTEAGWRIAQYHLTIPIPNHLARQITDLIKQSEATVVQ